MSPISLSKAVRSSLLSLQGTATMMASTQNRLSTGNKVNSALDNPNNYFTASALNGRASDLNNLMDGMKNGIQTLQAADNGLTSITKTLESMQSTLNQARQDKSFQTQSFDLAKIDANFDPTKQFTLEGGSVGNKVAVDLTTTGAGQTAGTTAKYVAPPAAAAASYGPGAAVVAKTTTTAQDAYHFTISFGGKSAEINIAADTARNTTAGLAAAINSAIGDTDLAGKVTIADATGKYTLTGPGSTDGAITVTNGTTASAGGTDADGFFGDVADSTPANRPVKVTGSDAKTEFTINGKAISLTTVTGADAATAIASINTQLGTDKKFEAFAQTGGKIGIRALTKDAGSLAIGGADASLFGSPTAGIVTGSTSTSLKFASTVDDLVTSVNANVGLAGKVRASNDNGKLRIENLSTQDLKIGGKSTSASTLDGSAGTSTIAGNSTRTDLATQFNNLRDQLDKTSDDTTFNGVNLLRGDKLKITFNETGTSSIDIQTKKGLSVNSANLSLSDLKAVDLDADSNIDDKLASVKTALNSVRSQSSTFGSNLSIVQNRQDFTTSMINTLQTGASNLTLADTNEEAANLLALQTRQSLSSSSLSLASQADQSVLQLIR